MMGVLRTRRVAKWIASTIFVCSLVMLIVGARGETLIWRQNGTGRAVLIRNFQFIVLRSPFGGFQEKNWPELELESHSRPMFPPLQGVLWTPNWGRFGAHWWWSIPLWIPVAALGMPAAFLWWRDRRRFAPGQCQRCGYDLTGNISGRCPECGTVMTLDRGDS